MDLEAGAWGIWRGCGPPPVSGQLDTAEAIGRHTRLACYAHWAANDAAVVVTQVSEDLQLPSAEAIPATAECRKAGANVPETGMNTEKDVKIYGTNSISPLSSIKVSKNELKTNRKRSGKTR